MSVASHVVDVECGSLVVVAHSEQGQAIELVFRNPGAWGLERSGFLISSLMGLISRHMARAKVIPPRCGIYLPDSDSEAFPHLKL